MTNLRRYYHEGQIYFLTHVTFERRPILVENGDLLWRAIEKTRAVAEFDLLAWSILPDHCHMVVGPRDEDLSLLMRRIKLSFSSQYRKRTALRSGRVWQYRFWDHVMRDQNDLNRHLDYVHYNPVKHGLINNPFEWKLSSATQYLKDGYYQSDWGTAEPLKFEGSFGE